MKPLIRCHCGSKFPTWNALALHWLRALRHGWPCSRVHAEGPVNG